MLDDKLEGQLSEIKEKILDGQIALFLGAGATCAAGGPDVETLILKIKEKFPKVDQSLNNFFDVCQDVFETPPYSRPELEDFLITHFNQIKPTPAHLIMTRYNWRTIFTTNFDDLIEQSYNESENKIKKIRPILSDQVPTQNFDKEYIQLFKIMGSIRARGGESGQMVLSGSDFRSALIRRRTHLNTLYDIIKDGYIMFIGYSFKDHIVFEIIDDLIKEKTIENLRWNYALFPQIPKMDEKTMHKFQRRRIIPIQCDFIKFFTYLDSNVKTEISKVPLKNEYIKLKSQKLKIEHNDARQYSEQFLFLTEDLINQDSGDQDDFFLGINKSWGVFRENWDFQRENYMTASFPTIPGGKISLELGGILERVKKELNNNNIEDNKVLLIKGMAGVGKTIALRRLAYDIYQSGEAPVIILDKTKVSVDYKSISTFIEELNTKLNSEINDIKKESQIKVLIIIDDASTFIRHINGLKNYLSSRGRPALIVAAERSNTWDTAFESYNIQIKNENIFDFGEQLTEDEKSRVIKHFTNLGYIPSIDLDWEYVLEKDFENSYFATIYTLVHPSKKPLNDIIKDQYKSLHDTTQKAFRYICLFHQFDLPINIELIVRSLRCSWTDLYDEVLTNNAKRVIFEEEDRFGNILFYTHHRIIAKKTIEFFLGDPEEQKDLFVEILTNAMLNNRKEREIVENLLIHHIGPNAKPIIFTYNQQRQIFQAVCEKNSIRTLIHHWGVLESDDRKFLEAEKLLIKALELPRYDIESYRGESEQNIKTTLGSLYTKMGMESYKKGDSNLAKQYFQKAENEFQEAKHGDFPNSSAYHAHAFMWYLRGKEAKDESDRIEYFTKSIEILSVAKDNLNDEDLKVIFELEEKLWAEMGDESRINTIINKLRDDYSTPRGYYLIAEFHLRQVNVDKQSKRSILYKKALSRLEEGLELFPNDENCLRLKCKILKELDPLNIKNYYKSLQKWEATATIPNAILLYELGRLSFILGYYDNSKLFFGRLRDGIGLGLKQRVRTQDPIRDKKGDIIKYEGRVINLFSPSEGRIRCDNLTEYREALAFRPIATKHQISVDEQVTFHIEFNYWGPRAEKVNKI